MFGLECLYDVFYTYPDNARDITYIKAIAKVKGRETPGTHPRNTIANTKVIDLLTVNRGLEDNYRTDELQH